MGIRKTKDERGKGHAHGVSSSRIAIIHKDMSLGGTEASLLNLLRYLVRRGQVVDLYLWSPSGPLLEAIPSGVNVIGDFPQTWMTDAFNVSPLASILSVRSPSTLKRLALWLAARILRRLRNPWILARRPRQRYSVAVSFSHYGFAPRFTVDSVSSVRKFMWWHHGDYRASARQTQRDLVYFRKMDGIVAVSHPTRDMLLDIFPEIAGKVSVIPNLLDVERISDLALRNEPLVPQRRRVRLVTVSRLSPEKGIDLAIRAAAALRASGHSFDWYLIGDGVERERLQGLIKAMALSDFVHMIGALTNPFPYVRSADIYVQPSRVEAHPLSILEAMALGRPIVASDIPANRRVLEDGRLGMLLPLDEHSFACGIKRLMNNHLERSTYTDRLSEWKPPNAEAEQKIDALFEIERRGG